MPHVGDNVRCVEGVGRRTRRLEGAVVNASATWWIVACAAVLLLVCACWLLQHRRARAQHEAEIARRDATAHAGYLQWQTHTRQLSDQLQGTLEAARLQHAAEIGAARAQHETEIERIRAWAVSGMRWDVGSRDRIIEAARRAGLHGFLATNVCFRAKGASGAFVHQIDHLLVTPYRMVVVEAKNWDGIIFHYRSGGTETLQQQLELFPELSGMPANTPYVMCVRDAAPPIVKRDDTGGDPTRQVFTQAMALKDALRQSPARIDMNYVDTCVFYAHPRSRVNAAPERMNHTVVVDGPGLDRLLATRTPTSRMIPLETVAAWVTAHGADMYGLGRYADTWVSPFTTASTPAPPQTRPRNR